ncbi:cation:proton antiporter [Candidatus Comchoanobacter bicostacola]|uniref:Cation:proton antiporter n=1 Tax=Candidatus Comchoanobacter bicostacola TaxID=2919598 RepID=A0ABY5DKG0_9GAMM|nr:cation:proton antiporter [Candidatus Comchoanobacter bicostacola]UTC24756.1 cation:proton antiporter [Candidatus Comchoanobacter bicostacola]
MQLEFVPVLFVIFFGAAVTSTMALYTRQSLMVAYIILGGLLGPWGFQFITEANVVQDIGDAGVIFLLFLLGMHLDPIGMLDKLRESAMVALLSSLLFMSIGYGICILFDLPMVDSLVIGLSLMFSSTIISLKLLPSGMIHSSPVSEFMISILLLQDLIAMIALLVVPTLNAGSLDIWPIVLRLGYLPFIIIFGFMVERFILSKLFDVFERNKEYLFLLAIAWCLSMAELCEVLGLSSEIGAFIAGVSLASDSRVSLYLVKALEPLRDFFLVLFFFSVGASYNFGMLNSVLYPTAALLVVAVLFKPYVFRILMARVGEPIDDSWELGFRLGQGSEFSLLLARISVANGVLGIEGTSIIQGVAIISFLVSSFWVVRRYATPIGAPEIH